MHLNIFFFPPFFSFSFIHFVDSHTQILDLVGSGYNDKVRPATMKLSHIAIFRTRASEGNASLSPEELERQYEDGEEDDLTDTKLAKSIPREDSNATIASVFSSVTQRSREVPFSFDVSQLEFGSTDRFSPPVSRSVTVRNHTDGKVMCTWTIRNGSQEYAFLSFPHTYTHPYSLTMVVYSPSFVHV
jgi:hypothetical protein